MHTLERRQIAESIEQLSRSWLLDPLSGVIDPETRHSIVGDGLHTRKLSLQDTRTDSLRFLEVANLLARWLRSEKEDKLPNMLVGVAAGGNRLATSMAAAVDSSSSSTVVGLRTEKKPRDRATNTH